MKLFLKSLAFGLIISITLSLLNLSANCTDIQERVFRLHILANSDSDEDQNLKLELRDEILKYTETLYANAENRNEAKSITQTHLNEINKFAQDFIYSKGYKYKVHSEVINMYFTTRNYDKYTLPAGYYDALRIVIGEGKGHNWWCVMFPPLCLPAAENKIQIENSFTSGENELIENGIKYEYKFKIVELFYDIKSAVSGNADWL